MSLFFSKWYLSHLFNAKRIPEINCEELCSTYPSIKPYLKEFAKKVIDADGHFSPTDEIIQIVQFYGGAEGPFSFFRIGEERDGNFFKFINNLRFEDLANEIAQADKVDNEAFAKKIWCHLENAIKKEWGYDSSLLIQNNSRYFSVVLEKFPEAVNFEDSIISYCIDNVFEDLKKSLKKCIVYNDGEFEDKIRKILEQSPKYTTASTKQTIPHFYIHDEGVKRLFFSINDSLEERKSRILGNMFFALDDSFRFNLEIEKVEFKKLSKEQIAEKVNACQRTDGQFVYEGIFMPRDIIANFIEKRFVVLTVIIKHQVEAPEEKIYKLKPYARNADE